MDKEKQLNNSTNKKPSIKPKFIIVPLAILIFLWILPSPGASSWGVNNFLQNLLVLFLPTIVILLIGKFFFIPVRRFVSLEMRRIIFWVLFGILLLIAWNIQSQGIEMSERDRYYQELHESIYLKHR